MKDLSQIKANIEATGQSVEIQQFCGITWKSEEDPNVIMTDGKIAVGELTADLGDGIVVTIPVCEDCLRLVSPTNESYSLG